MILFPRKSINGTLIKLYGLLINFINSKITHYTYLYLEAESPLKQKPTLVSLGIKESIHIVIFSTEACLCCYLSILKAKMKILKPYIITGDNVHKADRPHLI